MHYDAMSLEDVFLRLTDDQPEAAEEAPDEGAQDREKGGEEE